MNKKYIVCRDGFKNVTEEGKITGFQVLVRLPYYRGIPLSLVNDIQVGVDGEEFPRGSFTLTTSSGYAFTLDEMATVTKYRWEFGEKAVLFVKKEGGLKPGEHEVEVRLHKNISYLVLDKFKDHYDVARETLVLETA